MESRKNAPFYQRMILETPAEGGVGKTSRNRLMQLKYAAVSAIALACRSAIGGGRSKPAHTQERPGRSLQSRSGQLPEVLRLEVQTL
jgi:hypothetical protein